jgi:hypothetical protein
MIVPMSYENTLFEDVLRVHRFHTSMRPPAPTGWRARAERMAASAVAGVGAVAMATGVLPSKVIEASHDVLPFELSDNGLPTFMLGAMAMLIGWHKHRRASPAASHPFVPTIRYAHDVHALSASSSNSAEGRVYAITTLDGAEPDRHHVVLEYIALEPDESRTSSHARQNVPAVPLPS